MQNALSIIAGVLFVAGFYPYIKAIRRGDTHPAKVTWLIWLIVDGIALVGMYAKGALNGQIIGAVIGSVVVVVLSIKHGEGGWTWIDKVCSAGAFLAIALWLILSSPLLGIVISSVAILVGAIPTFQKAWQDPSGEDKIAWILWWLSCVFALAAVPQWTLANATAPIAFTVVETTVCLIIFLKKKTEIAA